MATHLDDPDRVYKFEKLEWPTLSMAPDGSSIVSSLIHPPPPAPRLDIPVPANTVCDAISSPDRYHPVFYEYPFLVYICAYRRTGKDTFARDISHGVFNQRQQTQEQHHWRVYVNAAMPPMRYSAVKFLMYTIAAVPLGRASSACTTVAFADGIRDIMTKRFGLPANFDFDAHKDTLMIDGKWLRQHMIECGSAGRSHDPDHWVKQAVLPCYGPVVSGMRNRVVISDFRFRNEFFAASENMKVAPVTIRLFRSGVPIPAPEIESEHDLDTFTTDLLCMSSLEAFDQCCERMPQYKSFVYVGNESWFCSCCDPAVRLGGTKTPV